MSKEDLVQQVGQVIWRNHWFTIFMLNDSIPEISRSALYTILNERLQHCKMCARWVPKMLSNHHKTQWMGAALMFLQCYQDERGFFEQNCLMGQGISSLRKSRNKKSNPNCRCILFPQIDQRSWSKPFPSENVWLLCSGTGEVDKDGRKLSEINARAVARWHCHFVG